MQEIRFELDTVPSRVRDDMARALLMTVDAYFKRPGVEADFQRWLVECENREQEEVGAAI